ncbi:MAG: hypothetical protein LBR17_09010 [Bacteroidales bacterium]|jgi:predicted histone-like DNA-binding protein|nr:hypothetical protein [Bacteroidales bacterium]
MSIKYVKVQRNITTGTTPGIRYLARIFRTGNINLEELCNEVAYATSFPQPDVMGVVKALEIAISTHILNGEAVKLGILGMFAPGIKATAKTSLAQVDATTIRRAYCRFYPSTTFMDSLSKVSFEEADTDITGLQP